MGEGSIQIHHDNTQKHWVTSTMQNNQIIVYDSKSIRGISTEIQDQIKAIYGVPRSVAIPRIAQQKGSKDCGLYAIAYAWHLALGEKPEDVVFCQKNMRDHLVNCFITQQMRSFPHTQTKATRTVFDYQFIE